MTERDDVTVQLLMQQVVLAVLKDQNLLTREYAQATEFRRPGSRETAELNGVQIGAVSLSSGRRGWKVVDQDKWLAWVQEHRPDEIVNVPTVRSSFTDAVLQEGGIPDPDTGVVEAPPGIGHVEGEPVLTVRPTKEARQAVLHALGQAGVDLGLVERAELEP